MFNTGDLVTTDPVCSDIGIVIAIGKHRQVHVYWPVSQKITKSGKNWAEINFEVMADGFNK